MNPAAGLLTALLLAPSGAVLGATVSRIGRRPDEQGRDGWAGVGTRRRRTPAGRNDGEGPSAYLRNERDRRKHRRGEAGRSENDRGTRIPNEDKGKGTGATAAAAVALTRDGRSSLLSVGAGDTVIPPAPHVDDDARRAASERRLSDAFRRLPNRPPPARRILNEPNCHLATNLWHPDNVYRDGCTDDGNHDPAWLSNMNALFFKSAQECCSNLFYGQDCEIRGPFCGGDGGDGDGGGVDSGGGNGDGGCTATEHGWHAGGLLSCFVCG